MTLEGEEMSLGKYAYGAATVGTAHVYARYAYTVRTLLLCVSGVAVSPGGEKEGREEEEGGIPGKKT